MSMNNSFFIFTSLSGDHDDHTIIVAIFGEWIKEVFYKLKQGRQDLIQTTLNLV